MAWFVLHFFLVAAASCRDALSLVAGGFTSLPSSLRSQAQRAEAGAAIVLAQRLAVSNPIRQTLAAYLNLAGIERGYSYFAPSVPASYKLVFELHYPDGRTEYELPQVSSRAARLRVAGMLDEIGRARHDALREHLVKLLAASAWRRHPDATSMRAIFGAVIPPSIRDFEHGERETYHFLYAYDFSRSD